MLQAQHKRILWLFVDSRVVIELFGVKKGKEV